MTVRWTRREFVKRLGLGAAAVGFVPHLDAFAQQTGVPRRLLIFFTPHGFDRERWKGTPGPNGTIGVVGRVLEKVADFKSKMVMFSGIDNPAAHNTPTVRNLRPHPHVKNFSSFLTGELVKDGNNKGAPTAISVDQVVARAIGSESRFESLQFAVRPGSNSLASGDDGVLLHAEPDPAKQFERIFASTGDTTPMAEPDPTTKHRRSVLDFVHRRLERFESKVSTDDRHKIENHLQSVRDFERELAAADEPVDTTALCDPVAPDGDYDPSSNEDVPALIKSNIDLLVMTLKCDLTRVATFQIGDDGGNISHTYLPDASSESEHRYRHTDGTELERIADFYHEHLNYLLTALDSVPEGDATMLDNTLVLYISPSGHNYDDNNVALFGSAGGVIETGRFHQYDGATNNDLMQTICQIMGVEVPSFGNPEWSNGMLTGLL